MGYGRRLRMGAGRRRLAWLVPVAVVGAIAVGVAVESSGASARPATGPAQRRAAADRRWPGPRRPRSRARSPRRPTLGLPDLPGSAQSASLSWSTFLTGTHSVRVWLDGPARQRMAVIGELSEADIVHNGRDLWTYTSESNAASHTVLPARSRRHDVAGDHAMMTPAAAVARVLKALSPTTSVAPGPNVTVAGRPAYTLVIAPRDARSTISRITVAIDSATYVPLRVQVFGASSAPAMSVGFSQVSFARPATSTFHFRIPAGAAITKHPFSGDVSRVQAPMPATTGGGHMRPRLIGSGWTSVIEVRNVEAMRGPAGMLQQFTVPVGSTGMRLLHTALVNAVVTADGRAFIGAVRPAALEHIAATTAR